MPSRESPTSGSRCWQPAAITWRRTGPGSAARPVCPGPSRAKTLELTETGDDRLIRRWLSFGGDDFDAAMAELDTRYLAVAPGEPS
jgi:hypothetical protein